MAELFSIVIPTFNSKKHVRETVRSALSQTYDNLEVVIDDNASKDGTQELLNQEFGSDPRFKLFSNKEDLNIPKGWNRGIFHATGDYRLLLHSDNLLHPRYVELMVEKMSQFGASVGYAECRYFDDTTPADLFSKSLDAQIPFAYLSEGSRSVDYVFRFQRMIPTSVVTMHRRCFENRPPFDPRYLWDPDIELMTWLVRHFGVIHLQTELAAIRTHVGQAPAWKDPTFSDQYRSLLELCNRQGLCEPHQFLIQWAASNRDICEKLSSLNGVKWTTYLKYFQRWIGAELTLVGYFLKDFGRKIKMMSKFLTRRFSGSHPS